MCARAQHAGTARTERKLGAGGGGRGVGAQRWRYTRCLINDYWHRIRPSDSLPDMAAGPAAVGAPTPFGQPRCPPVRTVAGGRGRRGGGATAVALHALFDQ
jgi:hypothetical protein